MLTEGIIFAFVAALSWGISDFFSKIVVGKIGSFRLLFTIVLIGTSAVVVYGLLFTKIPIITVNSLILSAITSAFLYSGTFIFFKGLQKGYASIISPVGSSWGIVTIILSIIFLGELLTTYQSLYVILIFSGIILMSVNLKEVIKKSKNKFVIGSGEAISAMVLWGIAMFLLKFVVNDLGIVWSIIIIRGISILFLFLYGKSKNLEFKFSGKYILLLLIIIGLIDTVAFLVYNLGISAEYLSLVVPVVSSYPFITLILAHLFLKERLVLNQYIGIAIILLGLTLISII